MNPDEKKAPEFKQTKAGGEHALIKDNQTPLDTTSCLIYTL